MYAGTGHRRQAAPQVCQFEDEGTQQEQHQVDDKADNSLLNDECKKTGVSGRMTPQRHKSEGISAELCGQEDAEQLSRKVVAELLDERNGNISARDQMPSVPEERVLQQAKQQDNCRHPEAQRLESG